VDIPVQRELLSSISPYFRRAFEGGFRERVEGVIPLNDVTEETFQIFLKWAHAQLRSSDSNVSIPDLSILPRDPVSMKTDSMVLAESLASCRIASEDGLFTETEMYGVDDMGYLYNLHYIPTDTSSGAIDEAGYQTHPMRYDERHKTYFLDECWKKNYQMAFMSYLELYIFADKYAIHQLRDDILTALIAQGKYGGWSTDPDPVFLEAAYANLPGSAQLIQWLVCVTIYHWLHDQHDSVEVCLRSLHEANAEFAFSVNVKQTRMLQVSRNFGEDYPWMATQDLLNSCVFHEHRVLSKGSCRRRIKDKAHVVAVIIEACLKDGVAMIEEQQGEEQLEEQLEEQDGN
jgi:hypothetical protein